MGRYAKFARLTFLIAVATALAGCGRTFYISESDAGVYKSVLSTASTANELFSDLHNRQLRIQFDSSGPAPRVSSTNMLETVRALQDIAAQERNHWVRLDKLSAQFEEQLTAWVNDRLTFLSDQGGSSIKLESLRDATVRFPSAPVFTYDSSQQSINLDTRVVVAIRGTLNVNLLGNFLSSFCSIPLNPFCSNPNGRWPLLIAIGLQLNVRFQFLDPYANGQTVKIHITPTPVNIDVRGDGQDLNSDVADSVRRVITQQLTPVDQTVMLAYDNFSLSGLGIVRNHNELTADYTSLPRNAEPLLDVVVRSSDGNLYHFRKAASSWSNAAIVPGPAPIAGDPALVASGAGQLELAAIANNGDLIYLAWREGKWQDAFASHLPNPPRPQYGYSATKSVIVATAPGQIEIFALDVDGHLWHLRRLNGKWQQPYRVAAADLHTASPLRDPVAVRWGNRVILFFADSGNRLFAQAYDLVRSAWGVPAAIPGSAIQFAPAAVSCNDGAADVVYVGTDGAPYHRTVLPDPNGGLNLSFLRETRIDGRLSATPALACSGYQQLELVGRGTDNIFYHNHFVGSIGPQGNIDGRRILFGWQGWEQVSERFFGSTFSGQIGSSVALTSTRGGQVQAALIEYAGQARLQYNSYDSRRFGHDSWKAVHWRGFEEVGRHNFIGAPALAVRDRQLELGWLGDRGLRILSLADINRSIPVYEGLSPVYPKSIVLSSAPGIVDTIAVGIDGSITHSRLLNSTVVQPRSLPSSGITRYAAVTDGAGQIDVVGVAQNYSLYHWRFADGGWQPPVQIPFFVGSRPIVPGGGGSGGSSVRPPWAPPPPRRGIPITRRPRETLSPMLNVSFQVGTRRRNPPPAPSQPPPVFFGAVVSDPVLVYTGAGQLELFAIGGSEDPLYRDQHLYHWRYVNGAWTDARQTPTNLSIDTLYFGQRAASSWGDGEVDLVVVEDGTGKMFRARFLPGGDDPHSGLTLLGDNFAPAFSQIGGNTIDVPALVAFSSSRVCVLATGTDNYLYENWAATPTYNPSRPRAWTRRDFALGLNLVWTGFQPLSSTEVQQGATVKVGDQEMITLVATPGGEILLDRFASGRWLGFSHLANQTQQRSTAGSSLIGTVY